MSQVHQRWLSLAVTEAVSSVATGGGPFGAVIVKDAAVIATGRNRVTLDVDPTAHAEVVAIRNACSALSDFALRGCTLYTSCEPCPLCLAASHWARLDAIYFAATRNDAAAAGFDDALFYAELEKPAAQRALQVTGLTVSDATAPFDAWQRLLGRTAY